MEMLKIFSGSIGRGAAAAATASALAVGGVVGSVAVGRGESPALAQAPGVVTKSVFATVTATVTTKETRSASVPASRSSSITPNRTPMSVPPSSNVDRSTSGCDPNYARFCVPVVNYDLNCPDIRARVQVVGFDVNGFDGNNDGVGCERYPWRN